MAGNSMKRLKSELKLFKDEAECFRDGTFAMHNDSNIKEAYAMIIGPDDSPYEGGFYFFHVNFKDSYPFDPPHFKSLTQGGRVRFNPNLYVEGKVCLSILGTWQGPEWSPIYNLKTILTAIRGQVLVENPLVNEPCYNTYSKTNSECVNYSAIVRNANYKYAIVEMLKGNIPVPDKYKKYYLPLIQKHFVKNYDKYITTANKAKKTEHKKSFSCSYSSQRATPDYDQHLSDMESIYVKLSIT